MNAGAAVNKVSPICVLLLQGPAMQQQRDGRQGAVQHDHKVRRCAGALPSFLPLLTVQCDHACPHIYRGRDPIYQAAFHGVCVDHTICE